MVVRHLKEPLQPTFSKSRALSETLKVQERTSLQAVLHYLSPHDLGQAIPDLEKRGNISWNVAKTAHESYSLDCQTYDKKKI